MEGLEEGGWPSQDLEPIPPFCHHATLVIHHPLDGAPAVLCKRASHGRGVSWRSWQRREQRNDRIPQIDGLRHPPQRVLHFSPVGVVGQYVGGWHWQIRKPVGAHHFGAANWDEQIPPRVVGVRLT